MYIVYLLSVVNQKEIIMLFICRNVVQNLHLNTGIDDFMNWNLRTDTNYLYSKVFLSSRYYKVEIT